MSDLTSKDLRIGNWVFRRDLAGKHHRSERILELGKKAVITGPINVICKYKDLQPIPITTEWLERAGFEKEIYWISGHRHKQYRCKDFYITLLQLQEGIYYVNAKFEAPINYVHQLQNLHHSLTGEELKFKAE